MQPFLLTPHRKSIAALALACLLALSACAPSSTESHSSTESATAQATPTQSAEDKALETAKSLAAGYDYAGALGALSGVSGEKIDTARTEIEQAQGAAVKWANNAEISHLFVHSLVVDPKRAFDGDSKTQGYLDYMVTIPEFEAILQDVYDRGYVLINPEHFVEKINGVMTYKDIMLPAGKKPLVLSQDDPNYYEFMDGDGFAKNLALQDGMVKATYIDAAGKESVGDYDMVPIVDRFVKEHPDFSYKGSKGILGVTGYNGVLGYRTSAIVYPDSPTREADIKTATQVSEALKKDGWRFASHSWGHLDLGKISAANLTADANKWDAEVRPIVGDTDLLIYPFGSDISGVAPYGGAKFEDLSARGFTTFFNVDASSAAWGQKGERFVRQARINLDGIRFNRTLKHGEKILDDFIDTKSVVDPARPR